MKILRYSDLIETPWKNGGGVTREIAHAESNGEKLWRISRADVTQDGAFSDFAGLTRVLTVVSDTGMDLEHDGGILVANPWTPVTFDGATKIHARLHGKALTDLNLMFDSNHCTAQFSTHQNHCSIQIEASLQEFIILHGLAGSPNINGESFAAGDTIFCDEPGKLVLQNGDAVLQITITYRTQIDATKLVIAAR